MDLMNAYHLVRICKGGRLKMAFNTPPGQFEYLFMSLDLTIAPNMA